MSSFHGTENHGGRQAVEEQNPGGRGAVQKVITDHTDLKGKYSSLNKYTFNIEANPSIYHCSLTKLH